MDKTQAILALRATALAIVDVVKDAGPMGAPGGLIYLALMNKGASYDTYEQIMAGICDAGLIEKRGECYFAKAGK